MVDKIKQIVIEKFIASNGSNGSSVVAIKNQLEISIDELSVLLNILYSEKLISVRKGINGKMIYPTKKLLNLQQ